MKRKVEDSRIKDIEVGFRLEEPLLNILQQGCDCRNTALFAGFLASELAYFSPAIKSN